MKSEAIKKLAAFSAAVMMAAAPLGDAAAFAPFGADGAISASAAETLTLTVTFDANGGKCGTKKAKVTYGGTISPLPAPTKSGYTFLGWYYGSTKVTEKTKIKLKKNFTLKASWQKNSCVLTFDPCGGSISSKTKTYKSGTIVGTLPVARKSGYTFMGWYTKKSGGTRIGYNTRISNVRDRTFYAHWAAPSFATLRYTFDNSKAGFGYSRNYVIPRARYKYIYDRFTADVLYDLYGRSWFGNCFGISASSAIFNIGTIKPQSFNSRYYFAKNLSLTDTNKTLGLTLLEYIESLQLIQFSDKVQLSMTSHENDVKSIVTRAKNCMNGKGKPLPICLYDSKKGAGHALLAYKMKTVNANTDRLYIYDSNFPTMSGAYITLFKQGTKYVAFSVDYTDYDYDTISWVDISDVWYVWQRKGQEGLYSLGSTISVGSENAGVYSADGALCAEIRNGEFTPYAEGFDIVHTMSADADGVVFTAPEGDYTVVAEGCTLDVKLLGGGRYYRVESDSDSMTFSLSDSRIELAAKAGDGYSVTISDPYGENVAEGVAEEDSVMIICADGSSTAVPIEDEQASGGEEIVTEELPAEEPSDEPAEDSSADEGAEVYYFDEEELTSDSFIVNELEAPDVGGEV